MVTVVLYISQPYAVGEAAHFKHLVLKVGKRYNIDTPNSSKVR